MEEARHHKRVHVEIPAVIETEHGDYKCHIVSISAGGCAIRTTAKVESGERLTLAIPLGVSGSVRLGAQAVWVAEDYRIDTFYREGVRFLRPLSEEQLQQLMPERAIA
jgi:hypothetical protein